MSLKYSSLKKNLNLSSSNAYMKKIIMAVLVTSALFAACSKDDNQSASEKKLKGVWTLEAVVTKITYSDGSVKKDSSTYGTNDNFVFNNDGTFTTVFTVNEETNQGAGTWAEGKDGKITIMTGYDTATYAQYGVNILTDTNLQFSSSQVSSDKSIETVFYLSK